jgi:hypothetical protein
VLGVHLRGGQHPAGRLHRAVAVGEHLPRPGDQPVQRLDRRTVQVDRRHRARRVGHRLRQRRRDQRVPGGEVPVQGHPAHARRLRDLGHRRRGIGAEQPQGGVEHRLPVAHGVGADGGLRRACGSGRRIGCG